jgi:hypothetical protein
MELKKYIVSERIIQSHFLYHFNLHFPHFENNGV